MNGKSDIISVTINIATSVFQHFFNNVQNLQKDKTNK